MMGTSIDATKAEVARRTIAEKKTASSLLVILKLITRCR